MVSVVIPTHNRPERLARALAALDGQGALEVIVVDDGSSPPARVPDGVGVVRHSVGRGPAAARNAGWRAARGEYVAFTDDDCEPRPGWLAALAAAAAPDAIVQGRIEPDPSERAAHPGAFTRTLSQTAASPFHPTANILYPRSLLERFGGFDESYPFAAGEDTDLGCAAVAHGARVVYADDALVYHAVHPLGPLGMIREARKWPPAVRTVKRHPALRAHLTHRIFWKPSHERLLLAALLGGGLARRTRGVSLLAALAAYAQVHRSEHGSWPGTFARLPAHVAIDTAEIAAVARGAWRERTLLL